MNADEFRAVLAQWPSGVTVVTTSLDGAPHGMTASSFTSVSLDPPLVLVCLARGARTHDAVLAAGAFVVNILGVDQAEVGKRFAGSSDARGARFDGLPVHTASTGAPVLADVLGWLDCTVHAVHDGGDHTVVVGEVQAAGTAIAGGPLLYHSRSWGRFHGAFPARAQLCETSVAVAARTLSAGAVVELAQRLVAAGIDRLHLGPLSTAVAVSDALAASSVQAETVVSAAAGDLARALELADLVEATVAAGETFAGSDCTGPLRLRVRDAFASLHATQATVGAVSAAGIAELVLDDASASAAPQQVRDVFAAVRGLIGPARLGIAVNDARGMAVVNALTAANQEVTEFDVAVGGWSDELLPGATTGAAATEELTHLFAAMGIETGLDVGALTETARWLESLIGEQLPGRLFRVGQRVPESV